MRKTEAQGQRSSHPPLGRALTTQFSKVCHYDHFVENMPIKDNHLLVNIRPM